MSAPSPHRIEFAIAEAQRLLAILTPEEREDEATLLGAIEGETDALEVLRRVVLAAEEAGTVADALKPTIQARQERKRRAELREERYRMVAGAMMAALGITKHVDPEFTITTRPGKPKLIVTDEDAIPLRFCVPTYKVEAAAVRAALETGEDVPGATLSNGTDIVTIRTK